MQTRALPRHLVILGAGGFAREVYWYALASGVHEVVLVDETVQNRSRLIWGDQTVLVISDWIEFLTNLELSAFRQFIVAVGKPALKQKLAASATHHGLKAAPTLVHADAHIYGPDCTVGDGGVIAPGCRLTTNVKVGNFVSLGINVAVGHDSVIGDYVTCNPGSQISGNVTLGAGVLIGTGACVNEKLTIAEDVTLGAQGCAIRDVSERGIIVAGVPAKRLAQTG
jgi:sugar O-acyltransferase (sialic acid O-acetyltransferase NeuD family)